MRTNEEILKAVHDKSEQMRRNRRKRQDILLGGSAFVFAVALIALTVVHMPSIMETIMPAGTVSMQASILTNSGLLGYAVVAIIAFLLGTAVAVFCGMLRVRRKKEDQANDRDR